MVTGMSFKPYWSFMDTIISPVDGEYDPSDIMVRYTVEYLAVSCAQVFMVINFALRVFFKLLTFF